MAKTKISEWSTTPASNTDIDGINIAEGCAPSGINDAIRDLMAQVRSWQSGASGDPFNGPMNGTIGATTAYSGAFTTLSASGTTTLSGLTASTALALDASKNVVSVANTGSGSNVLATSPTLVTPALGTPSSATLTNATGLPISTGVSGLGTGVATALAVNVGSAGAPVVNGGALGTPSSGTVTNLTGTASININGTVGATTPTTGAFTTTTVSTSETLSYGTANGVTYLNGSKVLTSGSALTFDGTSLDLGTVGAKVNFATTGSATRNYVGSSADGYSLEMVTQRGASQPLTYKQDYSVGHAWSIAGSGAMTLTSTGLGIGTSSPSTKLDVVGASAGSTVSTFTSNETGTTTSLAVFQRSGGAVAAAIKYNATNSPLTIDFGTTTSHALTFLTANTERMRITSAGDVGIGTSSPLEKLQVNGAILTTGSLSAVRTSAASLDFLSGNTRFISMGADASTKGGFIWYNSTNAAVTEGMRLDSAGNLGLGVTPSASSNLTNIEMPQGVQIGARKLAGYPQMYLSSNVSGDAYGPTYKINGYATQYRLESSAGKHEWYTAPSGTAGNAISFTQAMSLTADGDLLIGATSSVAGGALGVQWSKDSNGGYGYIRANLTTTYGHITFYNPNGQVGQISTNGSATTYATSSDYRLKNITGPITNSGAYIDSLNPVEGTWKADGSTFVGLIAHEVQEASRTQVATGTKDGAEMQAMDYSSAELIANLIAEVKSLRQRVATLEAQ